MSGLSVAEVLDRAADLIEPEGRWTQHWFAKGDDGGELPELSPLASCWCGVGAIFAAAGRSEKVGAEFLTAAVGVDDIGDFEVWNDAPERTQAEVVAKLREAAALAREQGK